MTSPSERDAEAAAELGMNRAADHANRKIDLWEVAAMAAIKLYIASVAKRDHDFMTEEVRLHVEERGMVAEPPDKRAWGRPIRKLIKAGVIAQATDDRGRELFARSKTGHKRPMPLWRWTGVPLT